MFKFLIPNYVWPHRTQVIKSFAKRLNKNIKICHLKNADTYRSHKFEYKLPSIVSFLEKY